MPTGVFRATIRAAASSLTRKIWPVPGLICAAIAPAKAEVTACRMQSAEAFIGLFMDDIDLQRAHTAEPLTYEIIDRNDATLPQPEQLLLYKTDLDFPVIPDRSVREKRKLRPSIRLTRGGLEAELTLMGPEPDASLRYLFLRNGGCWSLVRTSDDR